jgi:hypothetical protein
MVGQDFVTAIDALGAYAHRMCTCVDARRKTMPAARGMLMLRAGMASRHGTKRGASGSPRHLRSGRFRLRLVIGSLSPYRLQTIRGQPATN